MGEEGLNRGGGDAVGREVFAVRKLVTEALGRLRRHETMRFLRTVAEEISAWQWAVAECDRREVEVKNDFQSPRPDGQHRWFVAGDGDGRTGLAVPEVEPGQVALEGAPDHFPLGEPVRGRIGAEPASEGRIDRHVDT